MRKIQFIGLYALMTVTGCGDCDCVVPEEILLGKYIGPYTYIYQGKNPVDGAFYSDTTYTDTFIVTHLVRKDSIRFSNNTFKIEFLLQDGHTYTAGPYTTYRLTTTDSMYLDSYFYSGTDADHYYSETFSFRGKKR